MQTLKTLIQNHNTKLTNTILTLLIKSNTSLTPHQASSLISRAQIPLSRATYLLRLTVNPDTAVFNSLIALCARENHPEPPFRLLNELRVLNLKPDEVTFSSLIKCCHDLRMLNVLKGLVHKFGFSGNVVLVSGLVQRFMKFGCLDSGVKCFDECDIGCLDNVIWSVVINGYVRNGVFDKGRECFAKMVRFGFEFNEFCLSGVVGCVFDVREGEVIHGWCVKKGWLGGFSMHLCNAIMVMYGRCGRRWDGVKVFEEMTEWDVVSWTGRIGVAVDCWDAFEVFKRCVFSGCEVNEFTLINVLASVEGGETVDMGRQVHVMTWKGGFLGVTSVCNALISMYAKSGKMDDARCVFDEMVYLDSVSWNSLISGYSQHRLSNQAIACFSKMRNSLLQPNEYTLLSILEVLSDSKWVLQIHSLIVKLGFIHTDSILCRLITSYAKSSAVGYSKNLFLEIDRVDVVHVNAMLGAFDQCECYNDVQTLFYRRWNSSQNVDVTTFNIVLKSCAALSDLHQGKSLHSLAIKTAFSTDKFIESAVIDVYSKCGSIEDAEHVFQTATNVHNLVAWNAMIMGYAQFGCYSKAYDLLTKIPEFGMKPDEITYLGVLSSCAQAGLVNEARYHLSSMFDLHGVIPCLEHYACVVDVLGKVGKLDDAKKLIDNMPMLPDARIWQILLSACNIYGNVDIGMVAARELVALQPENESSFVLLSNLYASAGMWSDVRQLRREMKDKVVCKEPGSSGIQVKGLVHYFFADDTSHSQNEEIYMELNTLKNQMIQIPKEQDAFFAQFIA